MEYLMTYGWAILIIAVVLGVLFQLGVFSGSALTPKAQPGSCQVQRLLGQVSLEGQCTGLLPQTVGWFPAAGPAGSGISGQGYAKVPNAFLNGQTAWTLSAWIFQTSGAQDNVYAEGTGTCSIFGLDTGTNPVLFADWNLNYAGNWYSVTTSSRIKMNSWNFLTLTLSNGGTGTGNVILYLNGTSVYSGTFQEELTNGGAYSGLIGGAYQCNSNNFNGIFPGDIANLQIYNTTLSANEVKGLFLEGIGGAPVRIQNLAAWYPLNTNINDYSGNNNNGQAATGVSFNSTWNSQYTPP